MSAPKALGQGHHLLSARAELAPERPGGGVFLDPKAAEDAGTGGVGGDLRNLLGCIGHKETDARRMGEGDVGWALYGVPEADPLPAGALSKTEPDLSARRRIEGCAEPGKAC